MSFSGGLAYLASRRGSRDSVASAVSQLSNEDIGPLNFNATPRGRQRRTSNFLELPGEFKFIEELDGNKLRFLFTWANNTTKKFYFVPARRAVLNYCVTENNWKLLIKDKKTWRWIWEIKWEVDESKSKKSNWGQGPDRRKKITNSMECWWSVKTIK